MMYYPLLFATFWFLVRPGARTYQARLYHGALLVCIAAGLMVPFFHSSHGRYWFSMLPCMAIAGSAGLVGYYERLVRILGPGSESRGRTRRGLREAAILVVAAAIACILVV